MTPANGQLTCEIDVSGTYRIERASRRAVAESLAVQTKRQSVVRSLAAVVVCGVVLAAAVAGGAAWIG